MKIVAAHNPDSAIRRESSSGGIFSMLAEKIISQGGIVIGAAFNDKWEVEHIAVDTVRELSKLRGSKYAYSDIRTAMKSAREALAAGRKVLFSGTPCQVAAIKKTAGDNPDLLAVEVVCHGAPEARYWKMYLSELCKKNRRKLDQIKSINFRDKRTGWKGYSFTVVFSDGKEYTICYRDNLYMRAFLKNYSLREACFRCPFKYPDGSQADITLGDFWGIEEIDPKFDNELGTSLVIVRNDMAEKFLQDLEIDCCVDLDSACTHNPALISTPIKREGYAHFRKLAGKHNFRRATSKYVDDPKFLKFKIQVKKIVDQILHK